MKPPENRYAGAVRGRDDVVRRVDASTERHVCGPNCRVGHHTELLYRQEPGPVTVALAQAVADLVTAGRAVLDVRPAPEASLPAGFSTAWLVTYGPRPESRR